MIKNAMHPVSGEFVEVIPFDSPQAGSDILAWLRDSHPVEGTVKRMQNSDDSFLRLTRGTQRVYFFQGGYMCKDAKGNFTFYKPEEFEFDIL